MNVRIKVQNLPPAPEPTKPYHTPPEPPKGYGQSKSFAFFTPKDYDRVKEGMYGITDADVEPESPNGKANREKPRGGRKVYELGWEPQEFSDYLVNHTRRETGEHFGINTAQVDSRIEILIKRGYPATYVKQRNLGDLDAFWADVKKGKLTPRQLAEKHGLPMSTVRTRLRRARKNKDAE